LVPFERAGGELLFNLLAPRYERRSTIITSNLAFSEWVKVFGDEKLTTALLDRVTHHAHILATRGDSYRSNKRKAEADNRAPPIHQPPSMTATPPRAGG
jgi:DNA replication protein DnaC